MILKSEHIYIQHNIIATCITYIASDSVKKKFGHL